MPSQCWYSKFFWHHPPPRLLMSGSGWPLPSPPAPHLIWRSGSAIAVFMPSQCWYTEFGELTAINKIGRTRRWARSWKTASGGSVPTISAGDCGSSYDSKLWQRKVKLLRRWVLLLNENEWHNSTETANHDINWPMSTQLENTISFLVAKLHINIIMDDKKITKILFLFKNEQYF